MARIANSSFVTGTNGWRPLNLPTTVTANAVVDFSAYSGQHLLRASSTQAGGSVAFDLSAYTYDRVSVQGEADDGTQEVEVDSDGWATGLNPSFAVLAWVRATPGSGHFDGTLAIWQLPRPPANTSHDFRVSENWTLITDSYDLVAGGTQMRVEFYLNSPGHSLDIDSVIMV